MKYCAAINGPCKWKGDVKQCASNECPTKVVDDSGWKENTPNGDETD